MPRKSEAHAQLIAEIAKIIGTGEHNHALERLFQERNVSADVVKVWSDFEDTSPTGYPAEPTGATEGDQIIDAMGASDAQTELDYLRKRLDDLTGQITRERAGSYNTTQEARRTRRDPQTGAREKEVTFVRKAKLDETDEALNRLGYTIYEPGNDDGSPDDAA